MSLKLSELISASIAKNLEDRVAVSFSGGVDSTLIATVAKEHADVELFTAGVSGSQDIDYALRGAEALGLPLDVNLIDDQMAMDSYKKIHNYLKLDFLKIEILVPIRIIAKKAKEKGHSVILFGSGAEELFVGYDRYYRYFDEGKDLAVILEDEFRTLPKRDIGWVKKVCLKEGIEARFPYYDKDIADFMFSIPIEDRMAERELKKGFIREAGKILGVPEFILARRKKALQYGSGIHKMLLRHSKEINSDFPPL